MRNYWSVPAAEMLAALSSRVEGLTDAEAARRLARDGPNEIEGEADQRMLVLAARQLSNPLVLVLVFAAALSLLLRDWVDAAMVIAIVLASATLGFAHEWRASAAMRRLKLRLALMVTVRRNGRVCRVPATAVVAGDIVVLAAGNVVPADGVLLEARDFLVSEASLTGESFPVEKQPGRVDPGAGVSARTNCVFLGTSVRSGTASALVVHTGRGTELGGIADSLKARRPEGDFAHGLRGFGHLLLRVMFAIVLAVLTVNLLLDRPPLESVMFAVALAVGMSPELLPAVVSVTLARGAQVMARGGVLVRRLEAIENLGCIDVLCTDKTGTLTEGTTSLRRAVDVSGNDSMVVRRWAILNAHFETGIENPLDAALVEAGRKDGFDPKGWRKLDEIPYDFIRKRVTVAVSFDDDSTRCRLVTKGAFGPVLLSCSEVRRPDGTATPLDDEDRARLDALQRGMAEDGMRVLAVATRELAARAPFGHGDEAQMCLEGLLAFHDPPKSDAARAVADLRRLGIKLKVLSGDSRHVVAHVAGAVGLDRRALLTGAEVAALSNEALWHRAARTHLFAELDPQQKERIVRALQKTGHAVGYVGDGINDVPALHAADVGISVDNAVDVAREAADIVLLRPSLDILHGGVVEGRRSFANTLKYIAITTSANFGNMVSMALATMFLPFLPLLAKQILLNNLLSDVPSLAIAGDRVDPAALRRPQRWNMREVRRFMLVFGLVSTAFDLLTFALLRLHFDVDAATFHTAWFVVSLLTELAVVLVLRTRAPAWRSRPGKAVAAATVCVAVVTLGLPFVGPVARPLGLVPLGGSLLAAMLAVVAGYALTTEAVKLVAWARPRDSAASRRASS